ncbi:MAG: Prepilin-type cleavage/methylation domain containing protein [Thermacetogenium phaeum]|jgi:prepilin-type N-terminal cleavage/methylation domain-containing protein|uniref:Prepilin-type cleavage/methylation domain containing protein n=1 Tax=Thermacetogenium phaeum TaxID=85874 RepID=A0A101FGF6_9THEO|nr:MAG: Prepilin-type cleavage/methylation domain containing protein [Thermacetogenium phaeum]
MHLDNKNGMSLIEVVVAICILGLITVPLLNFFLTGNIFTSLARHDVAAVNTAQEIMEEIKSLPASYLGTAREGSDDTIVLEPKITDDLEGFLVALTGGLGAGQVREITQYDIPNHRATVSPAWEPNPWEQNPEYQPTYLVMRNIGSTFPFEITVEDTEFDGLKKITVTVFYQDRGSRREVSLTTDKFKR